MLDKNISTSIRLLKGNDVARMLNISRAFAYQLMRQGKIPTVRFGRSVRVRIEDLMSFITANSDNPNWEIDFPQLQPVNRYMGVVGDNRTLPLTTSDS